MINEEKKKSVKKIILIGAGLRGKVYTDKMSQMNGLFEVVAVAEPISDRRNDIQKRFNIPDSLCFESWEPLLAMPKFADAVIIATMDREHFAPAMAAIDKGYNLLLEKPMSATPDECVKIQKEAEKKRVIVLVCHVLRFTDFFRSLKKIIVSGTIGDVVHIQHAECVGNVHQSHSFVRGNWGNSDESSCMILQKSCHDMDILQWLIGKKCVRAQSFGGLYYFKAENAPENAPDYCISGCPSGEKCPYNAVKLYLDDKNNQWFRSSASKKVNPTDDDVENVLRNTQYGKCVFKCNNNVVDHQTVNLEFEGGATVSFTMCAFNRGGRSINIMGTRGEIHANMGDTEISVYDFESRTERKIKISDVTSDQTIVGGHGGGDSGIVYAFYDALCGGNSICSIGETCSNHMIAFAAEESRLTGKVVDMAEFNSKYYQ